MSDAGVLERGEITPAKTTALRPAWQPGQSGNPKGRPKGARNKLGEAFIEALHDKFKEQGSDAIQRVIDDKPEQFLKVVASIIPQEIQHSVAEDYDSLSDDALRAEFLRAAGAIQARIDAGREGSAAGAIEGSATQLPD